MNRLEALEFAEEVKTTVERLRDNPLALARAIEAMLHPPIERITTDRKIEVRTQIQEWQAQQQPGAEFNFAEMAEANGVDTQKPSERGFLAHLVRNTSGIDYRGAQRPRLTIRRLNGHSHD